MRENKYKAYGLVWLGKYRHYKGGRYRLMLIAKHSDSLEDHAIYQSLETKEYWTRPISEFRSLVDGKPRFEFIGLGEW